jgi:hypothetical protein
MAAQREWPTSQQARDLSRRARADTEGMWEWNDGTESSPRSR